MVGWVHLDDPCVSSGSFAFVGFIHARSGGYRVHFGSSGSLGCALGVVGFHCVHSYASKAWSFSIRFVGFIRSGPEFRRIGSILTRMRLQGWLGYLRRAMYVIGFIRVHVAAPWGSSGSFGFIQARPVCRRVHSGSLGSLWRVLGVVGFIQLRWVYCSASRAS